MEICSPSWGTIKGRKNFFCKTQQLAKTQKMVDSASLFIDGSKLIMRLVVIAIIASASVVSWVVIKAMFEQHGYNLLYGGLSLISDANIAKANAELLSFMLWCISHFVLLLLTLAMGFLGVSYVFQMNMFAAIDNKKHV